MNIPILYEDEDIVIVDKPAGITVNRAETTKDSITVQDWMEQKLSLTPVTIKGDSESHSSEGVFAQRGGIVHRLDKETSGVLILAKNPDALMELLRQFKEREVKKVYRALAHGKVTPSDGEIDVPVGRLPWNRKQFGILPGGRSSKTLYKVLKNYQNAKDKELLSYVELYPQSGRTHQIRVHLKYINHPIFADFLYAGRKTSRKDRMILPRVFLHAAQIAFTHPTNKKEVSFESPLPNELQKVLASFLPVD
jgi:23S rRNA pseudouridine1911/1915/1917 synthase